MHWHVTQGDAVTDHLTQQKSCVSRACKSRCAILKTRQSTNPKAAFLTLSA